MNLDDPRLLKPTKLNYPCQYCKRLGIGYYNPLKPQILICYVAYVNALQRYEKMTLIHYLLTHHLVDDIIRQIHLIMYQLPSNCHKDKFKFSDLIIFIKSFTE